ncbi:hypothetical protein DPMN_166405 [Dreissena polymorpha]|uniref:Uncharacterized protein n=1 Tax=Dreissena polymorpha TaxID=45954 RepID=A0A9D4IVG2_DREPO|nr:hypothetical protein DPMN_166405 [Dreissena polymorpha]
MEELKTDLKVLSYKKAAAAAKAELKALETMSQIDDDASSLRNQRFTFPSENPNKKVAQFVIDANNEKKEEKNHEEERISEVNNQDVINNMAQYLIRKELLVNRMSVFDDTAETYNG